MNDRDHEDRLDFYTATHKGHRRRLFNFSERVGITEFCDPDAVDDLGAEFRRISRMLRMHARHESEFIHPFLQSKFPGEAEFLEGEHSDLRTNLAELEAFYDDINSNPGKMQHCRVFGHEFYRALQRFISRYLDHMDEEERTMTKLWQSCTKEELQEVLLQMRSSMTEEQELEELRDIVPALAPHERVSLFQTLSKGLNSERYSDAWTLAEEILPAQEYSDLRERMESLKISRAD